MFGEEFSLPTYSGDVIRVRVNDWASAPLTHEQRVRAREAAFEIRVGVDWWHEPLIVAAQGLHEALYGFGGLASGRRLTAGIGTSAYLRQLVDDLERALEQGRIVVVEGAMPLLGIPPERELTARRRPAEPDLAPPKPRPRPNTEHLTFFEVRFVDEIGQAISGLEVEFSASGRVERVTSNGAGVAVLDNVTSMSASVGLVSLDAAEKLLQPRWAKSRSGRAPSGINTQKFVLTDGGLASVKLKPAVPNTVVITPPVGKLFVELLDKYGRIQHANQRYDISGPMQFAGRTDEQGRVQHDGILPGEYDLTLHVEVDGADGTSRVDDYTTPLVVLEADQNTPEVRRLGVVPRAVMARIGGMLFDTNKSFVLPSALPALRQLRQLYEQNAPADLLIVGHTDSSGQADVNDSVSLERADMTAAYLMDDADAWLGMYTDAKTPNRRWGPAEDQMMLAAWPDFARRPELEDPVRWYQRTRGLKVTGVANREMRRSLVTEYMLLDGVSVAQRALELQIDITTHGCGENFPLDASGAELDHAAADNQDDQLDRRVELFFFDKEFGILPPPPDKNSKPGSSEYPAWRRRATLLEDIAVGAEPIFEFRLHDAAHRVMPDAPCRITLAGETVTTRSDAEGWVRATLPPVCPDAAHIEWANAQGEFVYRCSVVVECNEGSEESVALARLCNLGYPALVNLELAVAAFQHDYDLPFERVCKDGAIPAAIRAKLDEIWTSRDCDAERV